MIHSIAFLFVLKILGEFQLRLRHLEKHLLQVLNEAKGRILDDDTVISSLETLKEEAAEVSKKVEETDEVMKGDIICTKMSRISFFFLISNFYLLI